MQNQKSGTSNNQNQNQNQGASNNQNQNRGNSNNQNQNAGNSNNQNQNRGNLNNQNQNRGNSNNQNQNRGNSNNQNQNVGNSNNQNQNRGNLNNQNQNRGNNQNQNRGNLNNQNQNRGNFNNQNQNRGNYNNQNQRPGASNNQNQRSGNSQNKNEDQKKEEEKDKSKIDDDTPPETKYTVFFVRHGETEWNEQNLFCGWYDAKLTKVGKEEAKRAGEILRDYLKENKMKIHVAHTSVLTRAVKTLEAILKELDYEEEVPVKQSWRLNERHYGGLTGMHKEETAMKYGAEQVMKWRRDFIEYPPPLTMANKYYKKVQEDPRYEEAAGGPKESEMPMFESMKMCYDRVLPYWRGEIAADLKRKKNVLVVGHGNSLRAIVKHLNQMTDQEIMSINLPTGIPFMYELNACMVATLSMKFLGDEETVKMAVQVVAYQGILDQGVPRWWLHIRQPQPPPDREAEEAEKKKKKKKGKKKKK